MNVYLGKSTNEMMGWVLSLVMLVSLVLPGSLHSAPAEAFPTKPIQNIVPYSPGGASDLSQRLVANYITKHLGQSMVIVNKPGGAAVPGTAELARSKNDGYTIGMNWYASFVLRPYVLKVPYKIEDYTFILGMNPQRMVVLVRSDSPFKTLKDLIDYAKNNPKKLLFSGSGAASWFHLTGMHLNQVTGMETQYVPYDGSRPAVVALLGGHVDYILSEPPSFQAELRDGSLRALAVCENERIPMLPNVPTATELGYKVAHPHMMIIMGPAGIPADRVKKIHDAYKAVLEDKEFLKTADSMGLEIVYKSGKEVKEELLQLDAIYKTLVPAVLKK
jgi:tripartite-type tricarboxylate transporter receptor subunit TctC